MKKFFSLLLLILLFLLSACSRVYLNKVDLFNEVVDSSGYITYTSRTYQKGEKFTTYEDLIVAKLRSDRIRVKKRDNIISIKIKDDFAYFMLGYNKKKTKNNTLYDFSIGYIDLNSSEVVFLDNFKRMENFIILKEYTYNNGIVYLIEDKYRHYEVGKTHFDLYDDLSLLQVEYDSIHHNEIIINNFSYELDISSEYLKINNYFYSFTISIDYLLENSVEFFEFSKIFNNYNYLEFQSCIVDNNKLYFTLTYRNMFFFIKGSFSNSMPQLIFEFDILKNKVKYITYHLNYGYSVIGVKKINV